MPIYGYHCDQCGHELEVLQSMSDAPLKACPNCMGPLRKMIYPAGIIYKGTGYYTTDYKSTSAGSKSTSDGGETRGESKGEADKPAAKTDSSAESKSGAANKSASASGSGESGGSKDSSSTKRGGSESSPVTKSAERSTGKGVS